MAGGEGGRGSEGCYYVAMFGATKDSFEIFSIYLFMKIVISC